MQQMTLLPETSERDQPAQARLGRADLRRRLEAVAPEPEAVKAADEELEDPQTILRALIDDLEEAIEIGRQMDDDLMRMMRQIAPKEATR